MKKVFAFGLDLEVEDWVKYLTVDGDGEVFGFVYKPWLDVDIWRSSRDEDESEIFGQISEPFTEVELLIVGV